MNNKFNCPICNDELEYNPYIHLSEMIFCKKCLCYFEHIQDCYGKHILINHIINSTNKIKCAWCSKEFELEDINEYCEDFDMGNMQYDEYYMICPDCNKPFKFKMCGNDIYFKSEIDIIGIKEYK